MPSLLDLPRELRDRIYHFALEDANCVRAFGGRWCAVGYGLQHAHHRVPWKWVFASKQIFHEARAQFHRDACIQSSDFPRMATDQQCASDGPFTFSPDLTRISTYSTMYRISASNLIPSMFTRYAHDPFLAGSSFLGNECHNWAMKSSIAPSLTRLQVIVTIPPNLGVGVGAETFTGCEILLGPPFQFDLSFQAVEIMLLCPEFEYRKYNVARLAGVMSVYEKVQNGLESAAIKLTGLPHSTGNIIRDWTTGGGDNLSQWWHIEVRRTGSSDRNERRVEHLGLQNWTEPCDVCSQLGVNCKSNHPARRFKRVEPKEEEDTRYFCATANETVRRVNGRFRIQQVA